jgi:hypothetical protein
MPKSHGYPVYPFSELKNIVKIRFFRSLMASLKKEKQALKNIFAFLQRGLSIL